MSWRTRFRSRPLLILVLCCICIGLYLGTGLYRQRQRKVFIEHRFAGHIRDLEAAMRSWPRKGHNDNWYETTETILAELQSRFDSEAFYSVSCSYDGHHGARSIKPLPETGFTRHQTVLFRHRYLQHQKLYSGRSFVGTELLIYEGWLPDAPEMRHYEIVFRRDDVDREMSSQIIR